MHKFKVGDTVKFTNARQGLIGKVGRVIHYDEGNYHTPTPMVTVEVNNLSGVTAIVSVWDWRLTKVEVSNA